MSDRYHAEGIEKPAMPDDGQDNRLVLLAVTGLVGPDCAARVRNSLLMVAGVVDAEVYYPLGLAEVVAKADAIETMALIEAVGLAGGDGSHAYFARILSGG